MPYVLKLALKVSKGFRKEHLNHGIDKRSQVSA
jgi:hypothetical protein